MIFQYYNQLSDMAIISAELAILLKGHHRYGSK